MSLTIKEIIERLEKEDQNKVLKLGWDASFCSRGDSSNLGVHETENVNIKTMLDILKNSLGKILEGYKGGFNLIDEKTRVSLDHNNTYSGEMLTERLLEYMLKDGV